MNGFDLSTSSNIMYGSIQAEYVYYGGTLIWSNGGIDYSTKYFTIEALEPIDITWNSGVQSNALQYSLDNGSSWTTINPSETITGVNTGAKVLFKGNIQSGGDWVGSGSIASTGQFDVYGNIMSLIDGDNFIGSTTALGTWMFWHFFYGVPVVNAEHLILPTENLTTNDVTCVYMEMFYGCNNLITAPVISATTVGHESCARMFQNCTSLTTAPVLPATTLGWASYAGMFSGCTSLTTAPVLPATTVTNRCYNEMFSGCTSLTTAPALPATDLQTWCYVGMFKNCTSLTTAPELPATLMFDTCYADMFEGCTSLTTAPVLPATTLKAYCYSRMFYGCSSLSYIDIYAEECDDYSAFNEWLNGVAVSGTVDCYQSLGLPIDDVSGIPVGWTASYKQPHDYSQDYLTLEAIEPNTITWYDDANQNTIDYSLDNGIVWQQLTAGSSISLNTGDKALFKAANLQIDQNSGIGKFGSTGQFKVYGNIMSLINADNFIGTTTISDNQFRNLFRDSGAAKANHLILPSTTVPYHAYDGMFAGTFGLRSVPELPATTLGECCYGGMFFLSGINTAPALPATTLAPYCYEGMFNQSGLTTAPALPAMTLAAGCYQHMFRSCGNLTTAPALPATTLADQCYSCMFNGCGSLTTAPALPATTLANWCYNEMFYGCTSLTTAPALPATTLNISCYSYMFADCSSLTTAPALPATTLSQSCYGCMFKGCTSLTTAPALPATTLADGAYMEMFNGCSLIDYVDVAATTMTFGNEFDRWLDNVAATGTVECYQSLGLPIDSASGIPVGWTPNYKTPPYERMYLTLEAVEPIDITWNSSVQGNALQYSQDNGSTWTTINPSETISGLNTNDKVLLKGNIQSGGDWVGSGSIASTGQYNVYGNVMSLIDGDNFIGSTTINDTAQFFRLFASSSVVNAEHLILPATTLSPKCYMYMFNGCTSLTAAPALPATTLADNCYDGMFWSCTSLTTAPALPATTLSTMCYIATFTDCTALTTAPALPATTLADSCYVEMFNGCTALTTAPTLPATTLANGCYRTMFQGCTGLTSAPALPATSLTNNCYQNMFNGCTGLTSAPALPATTLAEWCYADMFRGCTSLTTAPTLPATTLAASCYQNMFRDCTSLTTAPILPATSLADSCYGAMFNGCTSLTYVNIEAQTNNANNVFDHWLDTVAATGTVDCYQSLGLPIDNPSGIPVGWTPNYKESRQYLTFKANEPTDITWTDSSNNNSVEYSQDNGSTWNTLSSGSSITGLNTDDKVLFKATNLTVDQNTGIGTFSSTGQFDVYGNIMSLVNGDNFVGTTNINVAQFVNLFINSNVHSAEYLILPTITNYNCYQNMFQGCTSLASAPALPATTLTNGCYYGMFRGCTSLTAAPALPSTSLADGCYYAIFEGCTSLTTAPALPATTLTNNCYNAMFNGCSNLTTAPALPATNLANNCYDSMFQNCTSLTTAPALPATNLSTECYSNMFNNCTSLTTAPTLSATALVDSCYNSMFRGCTSLTAAPALPSTSLAYGCYRNMFSGCTSLTTAPALPATTLTDGCYTGMFSGCTSLTTAPALPATTLINRCYRAMFKDCTNLTTAPVLPATTLADQCYYRMFNGCSLLTYINIDAQTNNSSDAFYEWLGNVAATGTVECWQSLGLPLNDASGIPTGWTPNYKTPHYENQYLTFKANEPTDITWTDSSNNNSIEYSQDNGNTWNTLSSGSSITGLNTDDRVLFKASGLVISAINGIGKFSATGQFDAYGNIMSLINGDNFIGTTNISADQFRLLFSRSNIRSAEYLILPATTLANKCYQYMFDGCTSLTTAPALPATTLAFYCYGGMFDNCTSLTTAPELPATTLANSCYGGMFTGCTSLTTAPALPATTLTSGCYGGMFRNCTSLTTAPILPATTLADGCYQNMFYGCSLINYIDIDAQTNTYYGVFNGWLNGVAATGTVDCYQSLGLPTNSASGIPTGWTPNYKESRQYLTFKAVEPTDITWTDSSNNNSIEYSQDNGNTWTTLNSGSSIPTLNTGDKVLFKSSSLVISAINGIGTFSSTGKFDVYGNIMSLINGDNFVGTTNISANQFKSLFSYSNVRSAEYLILPTTTLTNNCYLDMFWNCTNLTTAPVLPATTLADSCYQNMFNGCTSLTTAPALPATTLADGCYAGMFIRCTSLTTTPTLSATTLAQSCYNGMFISCTSLTTAPTLPATTLTDHCYQDMFNSCTSLTTAPVLPATTLADSCYYNMFNGCTSLTYVDIDAQTNTYSNVFDNWLNDVAATGTIDCYQSLGLPTNSASGIPTGWNPNYKTPYRSQYLTFEALEQGTFNWRDSSNNNSIEYSLDDGNTWTTLNSGSSTPSVNANDKVLFKASNLTIDSSNGIGKFGSSGKFNIEGNIMSLVDGDNFISSTNISANQFRKLFYGSKVISATNLLLPANTLTSYCYSSMFNACTNLVLPPALPATTLADHCYYWMFNGCSSINSSIDISLPATTLAPYCYSCMFQDCTSLRYTPWLVATTLADNAYQSMFENCSYLHTVRVYAQTNNYTDVFKNWLLNAGKASTMTAHYVYCYQSLGLPSYSNDGIPDGWSANYLQ